MSDVVQMKWKWNFSRSCWIIFWILLFPDLENRNIKNANSMLYIWNIFNDNLKYYRHIFPAENAVYLRSINLCQIGWNKTTIWLGQARPNCQFYFSINLYKLVINQNSSLIVWSLLSLNVIWTGLNFGWLLVRMVFAPLILT